MCCQSKEQQVVWYNAINAYDGKVVGSSGGGVGGGQAYNYDGDVGAALSPTEARDSLTLSLPDLDSDNVVGTGFRPSTRENYMFTQQNAELIARVATKAAEIVNEEKGQQRDDGMSPSIVVLLIVVLNVASYWIRNGSEESYKVTLFFMNAFVLYIAFERTAPSSSTTKPKRQLKGPKARAAKGKKHTAFKETVAADELVRKVKPNTFTKLVPVGQTIPKGTSQPHSYGASDASLFSLRVGPNYKKNKQKAPSGPALYELHSMDFLYADAPLKQTSDKFKVPHIPGVTDISTGHKHIPPMLVINTWLPGEEPSMFAKNTDCETYSIPMVFVLTKDTLAQLKDIDNASPGVKLWSEWCRRAEKDAEFRGRFKCMGMIEDIESSG